jgi:hypothetical protein
MRTYREDKAFAKGLMLGAFIGVLAIPATFALLTLLSK